LVKIGPCPNDKEGAFTNPKSKHKRMTALAGGKSLREREFELLYQECYGTVYGWVRVRMASKEDTEDVVAEAFLHAARAFESFDPSRAKFSTWVITIARNCMISHFRKQRPTTAIEDVNETLYAVNGGQKDVEDRLLADALLAILDDDERELVALKYRDDMRNVDIAKELGMNPSTVATKLARALGKIRKVAKKGSSEPKEP